MITSKLTDFSHERRSSPMSGRAITSSFSSCGTLSLPILSTSSFMWKIFYQAIFWYWVHHYDAKIQNTFESRNFFAFSCWQSSCNHQTFRVKSEQTVAGLSIRSPLMDELNCWQPHKWCWWFLPNTQLQRKRITRALPMIRLNEWLQTCSDLLYVPN